jgi:hypothetical protein
MAQTADTARVMAIKAAMIATTGTPGWLYIKQLADNIVTKTVNEALDEEDPAKGESKRLKASALRKGFAELFAAIEATKNLAEPSEADNDFGNLELEMAAEK